MYPYIWSLKLREILSFRPKYSGFIYLQTIYLQTDFCHLHHELASMLDVEGDETQFKVCLWYFFITIFLSTLAFDSVNYL